MTEEEAQARLALIAIQRKRAALAAQKPAAPRERSEAIENLADVQGFGQRLLKGQTLGWGDEIAGVARAALDYVMPGGQGDQSFGDRYRMYRDDARAVDERFAERNPKTAFTAELAGGILSPVAKVAPGVGTTGGTGARLTQAVARGGAEGAVYGLGEGQGSMEDQLTSTAAGGATGAGTSFVLGGLGGALGRTLSNRRVEPDLRQPDGTIMPIHLAAPETGVGRLYRDWLASVPFAKGALKSQEAPFLERAAAEADTLGTAQQRAVTDAADSFRAQKEAMEDAYDTATYEIKSTKESALPAAKAQAKAKAQALSEKFMQQTYRDALPEHALPALEGVDVANPRKVEEAISNWWSNNGFDEVKSNTFSWVGDNDAGLIDSIRQKLAEDPDLAIEAYKAIPGLEAMTQKLRLAARPGQTVAPQDAVNALLQNSQTVGINGDALMAIRNQFARASNKGKNGRAPRAIASEIDTMIRTQLAAQDPALAAQFDDQLAKYTTALTLKDVLRSKKVRENFGFFTPSDWVSRSGKYGGKGMSLKQPPLEDTALAANRAVADAADATAVEKQLREETAAKLRGARLAKTQQKRALERNKRETDASLRENETTGPLAQANAQLARLNKAKSSPHTTLFSGLASTAAIGSAVTGGLVPYAVGLGAGVGAARGLVSKTGQELVAGQTEWQKALARALREGDTAKYTQLLSRFAAGRVTGEN